MHRSKARFLLFCSLAILLPACSSDDLAVTTFGGEGEGCYPNGTCDPGLWCLSNLCVSPPDGPFPPRDLPPWPPVDQGADAPLDAAVADLSIDIATDATDATGDPDQGPGCVNCVITLVGNGEPGFADGPALAAQLNSPSGLALKDGVLYIADRENHRIRKLEGGELTTIAGTGNPGFFDGAALNEARFFAPSGVTIDSKGTVYIADTGNHRIRRLRSGTVTTFAGSGSAGGTNDWGVKATFNSPRDITVDGFGVLYVADTFNNRVRKITANSQVTNLSADGYYNFVGTTGVAVDAAGQVFVAESQNHRILRASGNSIASIAGISGKPGFLDGYYNVALFRVPSSVAVDGAGRVYIVDSANHRLRRREDNHVTTIAGSGIPGYKDGDAKTAQFFAPFSAVVNEAGTRLYVSDVNNHVIRLVVLAP
ncbi:MAG: hypothetical protein JRH20_00290 [Deltaproteobacteria bacterium]|nr:hypothetical protein [Deltaproteobacteria bacterium]